MYRLEHTCTAWCLPCDSAGTIRHGMLLHTTSIVGEGDIRSSINRSLMGRGLFLNAMPAADAPPPQHTQRMFYDLEKAGHLPTRCTCTWRVFFIIYEGAIVENESTRLEQEGYQLDQENVLRPLPVLHRGPDLRGRTYRCWAKAVDVVTRRG